MGSLGCVGERKGLHAEKAQSAPTVILKLGIVIMPTGQGCCEEEMKYSVKGLAKL